LVDKYVWKRLLHIDSDYAAYTTYLLFFLHPYHFTIRSCSHLRLFENEEIKGYEDLEIDIFFTPAFQALIDVKYSAREAAQSTDLKTPFTDAFPAGFYEDKPSFDRAFEEEPPLCAKGLGECLASAETTDGTSFSVLHTNLATASDMVRTLHARLEPLLLFFVDAACAIDAADSNWEFLLAVETDANGAPEIVGFATVYRFYVYPDRCRLRLSQVLVLPPHQSRGAGKLIVDAVYDLATRLDAIDITLEDPTDDLRRLRDKKDLQAMLETPWVIEEASTLLTRVLSSKNKGKAPAIGENGAAAPRESNPSPLHPSAETLCKLQKEFRMSKQQARRMWENFMYAMATRKGSMELAAVKGMVLSWVETQVAMAKKGSEGKAIQETDKGFVMCRTKRKVAPGAVPVEEMTAEQMSRAVQAAVDDRIAEIHRTVVGRPLNIGDEGNLE
jgi:histone acetyltransferase 1